ncbi:MAG: calcium-binding protein, partial [Pseudomonadota bacterium]
MKDLVEDRSANSQDEIMAEIADGITLMEPRILLDAVLNLDPGLTDGDALIAAAAALKAHDSEFDRVLEGIESSFAQSIGGVAGAYDSDSNTGFGDAGAGEVVADKVFKAVREAVDASLVAFETNLQDFAQAQGQLLLDAVNASLHSLIGFVPSTIDTVADLQSYLTVDLVSDIDALNTAASVLGGDTAAFNGQLILNGVMTYATANNLTADLFEIDLQDAQVATGSFIGIPTGFVDVSYTQDGDDVRVSVGAPNLTLDIDEGTEGSPFDELDNVSTPVRDFAFDFDLGATVTADELRIGSSDFALAEFKIGDPDTKTQFVGATEVITNIAQLGFQAQGFGDLNIAGLYDKNIEASGGLTGEAALSFATTITGPFDDTFSPVDVGGSGVIIHHDVRLFGATITTAPVSTVVQPTAPVAFQAGTPAGGGTGFGGAGSGNANENIADAGLIFGGLAAILEEADNAIDAVLEATALPIIGDNLGLGFTLFDDLRFDLIPQTSAQSGSANSDGSPKTTADLLENELNTGLNAVLGTSNVRYVEAEIVGFADTSQNFLHGNLGFTTKIFDAQIASPFDFGVDLPGLDFDFENGSPLTLTTFADLNIGFGVDGSGFFLLNDTDQSEISLTFEVDAGDFEGQFSVGGLLDFSAVAVKDPTQLATFDFAEAPASGEKGDVKLTATLGADLFADFGTATAKDLTGITATKGNGTVVTWEHEVRFDEINRATALGQSIVETDLSANADINLQLTGNVLDPTTGKPVSITVDTDDGPRDVNVLPTLMTELVIDASLTPGGAGIQLDQVILNDLRLDAADLYLGVIEPFIDPLQPFVEPIQGLYDVINTQPFSTVLPLAATAVPAIGLASDIVTIANKFADIVQGLNETDGFVLAGDVFFENGVPTFKADINASNGDPDNAPQSFEDYLAEAGVTKPTTNSLSIDIPILTDVSNMLALIQGNFDQVELVTAEFVGLDFDINSKSITSFITDEIDDLGIDSRVIEAIIGEFSASASIEAFFGFQADYDLSGLQGFVDSQDIGALLSGVFIDTDAPNGDGGILDFSASASLNFSKGLDIGVASGEAGLKASGGGSASVSLDDPNGDGKLRLNEITKLLSEIDPTDFDEYMTAFFDGSLDFDFSFRIFGNIKAVGVTVFDESITFIKIEEDLSFNGGGGVNLVLSDNLPGDTTVLNIGSKAADSFAVRNVTEFSNTVEQINLHGDANQVLATWIRVHDGSPDFVVSTPALIDTFEANAVIVPGGEGINIVDSSGLSNVDTLTYLGDGLPFNNNIDLSTTGFHVVFGGDTGNDVRALGNVADDATYWVFGGRGDDNVVIEGGNSLFFAEDFYGVRDAFGAAFKNGGFSQAAAEAVFASHMQSQGIGDGTFAGALAALKDHHTINTQLTAATATNLWTAGRDGHDVGTHVGFGGAGHDSFIVRGADTATALTGAGDDNIQLTTANGGFGEGGAGSDFVTANDGDDEVYGFAKAAEASSFLDSGANRALLYQDGNDHIFLGSGDDSAFGQFGDDVIEGSAGDDRVDGGQGNDIVAGGKIIAKKADGSILSISDLTVQGAEGTTISALTDVSQLVPLAASLVFNDGKDSVGGGDGDDIVLGGFDADTLTATSGNNVIIGDNAAIEFISAGVIKSIISQDVGSDQNGGDSIFGGSGFDLIVGGGSAIATASGFNSEWVQDTASANILIGDDAEIFSDTNVLGDVTLIRSVAGAGDDARDNLFSGAGSILIGGEGSDQMRSRLGGSILIGDLGTVDFVAGKITSTDTDTFGHDSIAFSVAGNAGTVGAANFIIGGGGSDLVGGTAFTDYAIADSGEITFDAAIWEEMKSHTFIQDRAAASAAELAEEDAALARFEGLVSKMTSAGLESDGDDNFRLREGGDRLIAGGGNDGPTQSTTGVILEVNGRGFGDGIFVLDSGTIDLANGTAEAVSNEYAGNDAISTGAGNHIILAGGGDDLVELGRHDFTSRAMTAEEFATRNGNGNHAILGDSGTITWDVATGAIKVLNSLSRATDGNDTVG